MPLETFYRTEAVWKTPSCEMPCESSPARSACASDVSRRTWATTAAHADVQPYLDAIRRELFELKARREQLEVRRRELREVQPGTTKEKQAAHALAAPSHSTGGLTSAQARSDVESTPAHVGVRGEAGVAVLAHGAAIPSEFERRRQRAVTPHLAVKNALRTAATGDSTLVMGSFLLEDNPRVCTFGRERRFRPLVERQGRYYAGCDAAVGRQTRERLVGSAGWPTALTPSSETPGPGAYTPRYNKVSLPSRHC